MMVRILHKSIAGPGKEGEISNNDKKFASCETTDTHTKINCNREVSQKTTVTLKPLLLARNLNP